VINRAQAIDAGLTADVIRGLRERGEWLDVLPGVFRTADRELTADGRIRAAALWAAPLVCVSGTAAAYWWGLLDTPSVGAVQVTVPRSRGLRSTTGVAVRRRFLPRADRTVLRGLPITGLALTALEAAVTLGPAGQALLDRALQRRVSIAQVRSAHLRNLGRTGSSDAGALLDAASDRAAAASERRFLGLMRQAGIGGWAVNRKVVAGAAGPADAVLEEHRLAVEIDGWAWHHQPDRFQRDREKQNALVNQGWRVLRFTWLDLTQRPDRVVAQVRRAMITISG
jgi:very-short-patch-repair endonuclease